MSRRALLINSLIVLGLAAAGCDRLLPQSGDALPTVQTVPTPAAPPTVAPVGTAVFGPADEVAAAAPSQLRIWLPPEVGSRTPQSSEILTEQLRDFNSRYPELELLVEQKPVTGAGGMLDYLRTGAGVAPDILPDLIVLPTTFLADAGVRQLVSPIDGAIMATAVEDLYPATLAYLAYDGAYYGYPFAVTGLTHMISSPEVITRTASLQWNGFITDTLNTLLLPIDGRDGALFGLQFYLANDGALTNELGQPDLQVESLALTLDQISQGKPNLLQSYQLRTAAEAWQLYQLGVCNHALTRPDVVLPQLQTVDAGDLQGRPRTYRALPGPDGALAPRISTWAWVITADDPVSLSLAAELMQHLMDGQRVREWISAGQLLAASRSVNQTLATEDRYFAFVDQELLRAEPLPLEASSRVLDVIGSAVYEVLTTDRTPQNIAEEAIAELRQ